MAARLPSRIWIAVTIFRLFNALSIATFFQPDEFWQSLEVAHRAVFGYGYLTWEWRERIRSFAYPAVYALLFEILKLFGLDSVGNSPVRRYNFWNQEIRDVQSLLPLDRSLHRNFLEG